MLLVCALPIGKGCLARFSTPVMHDGHDYLWLSSESVLVGDGNIGDALLYGSRCFVGWLSFENGVGSTSYASNPALSRK
ncbi:hypothetical protein MIMGU_mgv1a024315mg [Erythranthe guttata]|uniref:Uncharacterized protein n=1 Tax=Erythranthe guttata TaxID=4155 RepID=A0A022PX76_ERYGU|nr:hypothetical protein MIMGU_mgv1a020555mg [Erythranthe guttata]EYU20933.1 hypothetical protein MIMGU_mgv1a025489mg [Erythranthe guttata]EYU20936.1 hypothetical protein MIMGU_mgv1a024263mg [Erythranthe guttata]EYU20942.1 hypothetical protein MIMGU_mgv1a017376mg [Erythranthe guttata]EYU26782.1 hypothetical protein MIMGU_mgv1a017642mg [Erythranthe guttata]